MKIYKLRNTCVVKMYNEFDRFRCSIVFLPSIVLESSNGHISYATKYPLSMLKRSA